MALVVTLILLSVITFMTVTFLATTRRERVSVSVTASQTDAQLMAETALERAKAHVAAQILLQPNPLYFGLVVSRNLDGTGLYDLNTIATNLFFDPRPPVFIDTDGDGAVDDFRFFLNLNRNTTNGRAIYDPSLTGPNLLWLDVAGDPEWIGVLERSGLPHGPNNRFIGRYAFIILPAGKTLDVNFNHNYAKGINSRINTNLNADSSEGFLRNQGFGPWEINLAAFLRDLNPNLWNTYNFNPNPVGPGTSTGAAFTNRGAMAFIRYRYNGLYIAGSVRSAAEYFGTNVFNVFTNDWIDAYANGPLIGLSPELPFVPPWPDADESPTNRWPGAESTNQFFQISDFFDTNKMGISFVTNLVAAMAYTNGFDNTTFYRWLAQLGTDTQPLPATLPTFDFASLTNADLDTVLRTNKLNLNYVNVLPNLATNLFLWAPAAFFTNAAQLLLRANMIGRTNGLGVANYYIGETIVRPNFGVTNIQVYPFNEYSSSVHRLLQLAANIYDATHPNIFPSVFRPICRRVGNAVFISGYEEVIDGLSLLPPNRTVRDVSDANLAPNDLVYGVPVIVGAKKRFPNFNEVALLTSVEAVRKMRVDKPATNAPSSQWRTNQMFFLNIANAFGVEAWNSYQFPLGISQVFQAYPRRLQLYVSNYMTVTLTNDIGYTRTIGRGFQPVINPVPIPANNWVGYHFPLTNATLESFYRPFNLRVPLYTNIISASNLVYRANANNFDTNISNWETNVPLVAPRWDLIVSNKLMYALVDIDATPSRMVDCVLLDGLTVSTNITEGLVTGIAFVSGSSDLSQMWLTNRASLNVPTLGMVNQIRASLGDLQPPWNNYSQSGQSAPIQDRQKSIDNFRVFLGLPPLYYTGARTNELKYTNVVVQAPYTAVGNFTLLSRWWANDPLVHYTVQDLTDPRSANPTFVATNVVLTNYTLGELNQRYQPWGGYPRSSAADPFDYEFRVKDPLIYGSDDWEFPTNKFPSPGWLSRVHRGTPWQTVYYKSALLDTNSWAVWSGSYGTEPTNDWRLADLFTTLPHPNAMRGLLSINQTNLPPWSAVLGAVSVPRYINILVSNVDTPVLTTDFIRPAADARELVNTNQPLGIVTGIERERARRGGLFRRLSELMAVPELTVASPFLYPTNQAMLDQRQYVLNDTAYERIPQQILSLLKEGDDARFVIYAYGQSLKPADRSIFLGSPYSQLCTNYQITGEMVTRTVMRFEPVIVFDNSNRALTNLHAVVEAFNILSTD